MEYEPVIGLEVHVQLSTRSKMFCACGADYQSAEPNTRVCPVCLALPGTLPVVNRQAVESAIMIGLALNCRITQVTKFDRKNYAYPDLMKGYQISQYDQPICQQGRIDLPTGDGQPGLRSVRINRVHMEEDVARLVHIAGPDGGPGYSLMDVNRAGVPLMEIVSEPDLRSTDQVEAYLSGLQAIIRYLGVGTANMEEGSFRCDANVSVRPRGSDELFTKVEVKNMNRIRAVMRAIEYEIDRQVKAYESGGRVVQETRGWDDARGVTVPQRSKEEAHDYRYFPEPDLPPLHVSAQWVDEIRALMPELPADRRARFQEEWGLSAYDAALLTATRSTADYFEKVLATVSSQPPDAREAFAEATANWLNGEMARLMNASGLEDIAQTRIQPGHLAVLVDKFRNRELNNTTAKQVFEEMFTTGKGPAEIISDRGLGLVSDTSSLGPLVDQAIAANRSAVDDYLKGKETAVRFLVGQVMKASRGQADPQLATSLIKERLDSIRTATWSE